MFHQLVPELLLGREELPSIRKTLGLTTLGWKGELQGVDRWRQRLKTSRNRVAGVYGGEEVDDHIHEGDRMIEPKFMEMTKELFKIAKLTSSFLLPYPQYTVNVYVIQ